MNYTKKSNYLLSSSSILFFLLLLLILKMIKIPHTYAVNGQTMFISDTKYENQGYFIYVLDFKKEEFLKSHNLQSITIFFPVNKHYLTIFFPKWNDNNQLLITENINADSYLNQVVLVIIGKESLLTFIWNNITT